jgi:hypothetical protein
LPNEPFPFIKVSVGLAIANELLEQGIPAHKVLQFAPHVLLKFARSRCPSLRALAVTGLSIFIAEYPALTQNLEELVHCITEVLDPRFPRACCSATYGLGRILVAMASNLRGSLYKEVSGLYWDHLPLEQPDEETASVCRQLATLIARFAHICLSASCVAFCTITQNINFDECIMYDSDARSLLWTLSKPTRKSSMRKS